MNYKKLNILISIYATSITVGREERTGSTCEVSSDEKKKSNIFSLFHGATHQIVANNANITSNTTTHQIVSFCINS